MEKASLRFSRTDTQMIESHGSFHIATMSQSIVGIFFTVSREVLPFSKGEVVAQWGAL
jgi:hypothetical protein